MTPEFLFPSMYFDDGYARLSERDIIKIYSDLLVLDKINYRFVENVIDEFGCVKRYTYDGTTSDYL